MVAGPARCEPSPGVDHHQSNMCKKGLPRQAQADGKGTSSWQLGAAACAAAAIAALVLQGSTEVCPAGEGLGDGGWCGGEIFERELPPTTCNIPRRPFADLLSKEDFPEYPVSSSIILMGGRSRLGRRNEGGRRPLCR